MTRRRIIVALVGAGVVAIAACGFPDLQYAPEGSTSDEGSADATPDGASRGEGGSTFVPPSDVDPDGGGGTDAATAPDAIARPEAGADAGCCDCDMDGYFSSRACGATADTEIDCDDFNAGIHPHQDFVKSPWDDSSPHKLRFDWNCDNMVTKQFAYGVNCGLLATCGIGFENDPDCATIGTFDTCKTSLDLILGVQVCSSDPMNPPRTLTQGCH